MATFSRLPQAVPPPAFDPTAFASGLSPAQAKLFKGLGQNIKGDYASFAKNAGFGGDVAGGFQKWLGQRAPGPALSGPISPPGMPPPLGTGGGVGGGTTPPGPGNLPPPRPGGQGISPPGMPPPLAKRPSLRVMKKMGGSVSAATQTPSVQALKSY